ncbi:hypothetical protein C8J57DRAFT_1680996 [Mycena rebaudengoi]|nr:hypothetical protein C8J57DRAFT_1680996 [Mycena rebaudengoi]
MSPRMWAADLTNFDDLLDYVRNARPFPFWNCIYNVDFHAPVVYRSDCTALTNDDESVFYTTLFGKAAGPVSDLTKLRLLRWSATATVYLPTGNPVIPDSTIGASDSTTLPNMNAGRRYKRKACDSAPPSPAELIKTQPLPWRLSPPLPSWFSSCMIPTSDPEAPPWDGEWNSEIFPPPSPTVHPPFIQHPTVQPTANSSDSGGDSPMSFDEDHCGSRDAPLSPMDEDSETVDDRVPPWADLGEPAFYTTSLPLRYSCPVDDLVWALKVPGGSPFLTILKQTPRRLIIPQMTIQLEVETRCAAQLSWVIHRTVNSPGRQPLYLHQRLNVPESPELVSSSGVGNSGHPADPASSPPPGGPDRATSRRNPYLLCLALLIAFLHTRHHVSFRACSIILLALSMIFSTLPSNTLGGETFPRTLTTIFSRFNLKDRFTEYPICYLCHRIFEQSVGPDTLCPDCECRTFRPKTHSLFQRLFQSESEPVIQIDSDEDIVGVPEEGQPYVVAPLQPLSDALQHLFERPGNVSAGRLRSG